MGTGVDSVPFFIYYSFTVNELRGSTMFYHVLNDYTLEYDDQIKAVDLAGCTPRHLTIFNNEGVWYRNEQGELVYVWIESDHDYSGERV